MDESQKEVEKVEKQKSSMLEGISPRWWIAIICVAIYIVAFLPNKIVYLAMLLGFIILISRSKKSEIKRITEKQAKALVDKRIMEMQKSGEIEPYVVVKRSMICYMKSVSDNLKYLFGGLTFYYPNGAEKYKMWTVWLTEPLYGDTFFQESDFQVTGREYPPVQIPPIFKKMLKEKRLSSIWARSGDSR